MDFSTKTSAKLKGVTLIELLVTLVVASIIVAQAIPSYRQFSIRQEINNTSNSLLVDMMFLRNAAITTGKKLTILSKDNSNWSKGWLIFNDENSNAILDGTETELRSSQEIPNSITISANVSSISINSIGALINDIPILTIEHDEVDESKQIKTNRAGLTSQIEL